MRIRKLLLIHPGRSTRALIKKYVFSELSDTQIIEAESGAQALDHMGAQKFDVIIAAERLKDMDLGAFKARLASEVSSNLAALIVISDSESPKVRERLLQQGFERVVQLRVRPADLIEKINTVCDPRKWRKNARYHIPQAAVVVSAPTRQIEAALINVSLGGALVELTTDDPSALMNGGLSLALHIPVAETRAVIDGLATKLLRVEAVTWTLGHVPKTMRATFVFTDLKAGTLAKLEELMQMAQEEKLSATEVID